MKRESMKLLKKVLASVLSVAMVATMGGVSNMANTAKAAENDVIAYFTYITENWTSYNWDYDLGDTAPVKSTTATVTGEGEYTVGLDFTDTASGFATGMNFGAVGISNAEEKYVNYTIQIKSFKVNGEEVALNKGYTCSDDEVITHYNVYNVWIPPVTDVLSARSYDGSLEGATATPLDKELLPTEIKTIKVTFAYAAPDPSRTPTVKPTVTPSVTPSVTTPSTSGAYFMYISDDWDSQYWDDGKDYAPVVATTAKVTGEGEYTVGLDFTKTVSGHATGMMFGVVGISNGEKKYADYTIQIKSFKVNGEEVHLNKGYTCSDDGKVTRYNVYNEWADPVTDVLSARSYDGSLEGATATPLDKELLPSEIKTIEVTFDYAAPKRNEPTETPSVKPTETPTVEPSVKPSLVPTKTPAKSLAKGKKVTVGKNTFKVTDSKKIELITVKKAKSIIIPATVKKNGVTYKVTSVGKNAFKGCAKLKKVTLGKNITVIKANAFRGCKNLTAVNCKAKLKKVAKGAFKGTKKIKVTGKSAKANRKLIKKSGAKVK